MNGAEQSGVLIAGRYRLGVLLGQGGMGLVYRARDEVLHRDLAIKLMLPARRDSAAGERFLREARATARIVDPHVVATYDFGPHGDGFYLAMELVEGRTLAEELRQTGPLPSGRATDIVRQAAAGLAAAHRHGIVHRDVKPGNLLLATDGTVKVADFGIARILNDGTTALTVTGQIVGTSHYLAPERALNEPADAAADIYSLGCVLYQMVTGDPPFTADAPAGILYQHVEAAPMAPSEHRPELPGELDALVLWMLAKDPARRPTAAQVASNATPPTGPATVGDTAAVAAIAPAAAAAHHRRLTRRMMAGAGATTALAMSATVGALLGLSNLEPPSTNLVPPGSTASPAPSVEPGTSRTVLPTTAPPSATTKRQPTPRQASAEVTASPPRVTVSSQPTVTASSVQPPTATPPSLTTPSITSPTPKPTEPSPSPTPSVIRTPTPSATPTESTTPPAATPNQTGDDPQD